MNLQKANKIINEYGAILEEKGESGLVVAPVSMLPCPKNEIKAAIKYLLWYPASRLTQQMRNSLKVSYMCLADFVEDEEAQIANSFHEWTRKAASDERLKEMLSSLPNTGEKAVEITDRIYQESKSLLEELRAMGKIVTCKNRGTKGMFCQIRLNSGERVLISIAQTGVRISKLGFGGLMPTKIVWESSDMPRMVGLFGDEGEPDRSLLDGIIAKLIDCKSIGEIRRKLDIDGEEREGC